MEDFIEDAVEKKTETTEVDENIEDKPAEEIVGEDKPDEVISWFKEKGFEASTREELTPFIEKVKNYDTESQKVKASEAKIAELSAREADMAEKFTYLKDLADPLKTFGSLEEYKAALLKKQRPDLDPVSLGKVVTKDFKDSDPRDILKLQMKLNFPDLNESEVETYLAEKYGTEDFSTSTELKELETLSQTKIKIDAREALKEFTTLKDGVQVPEAIDIDAYLSKKKTDTKESIEKAQQAWEPLVKTIPEMLDKIVITEGGKPVFEFNIEDSYRKQVSDSIGDVKQYLIDNGVEPNAENVRIAAEQLKENYMNQPENRLKIMKAYATQMVVNRELELKKEFNNPSGSNTKQNSKVPDKTTEEQEYDAVMADIKGKR